MARARFKCISKTGIETFTVHLEPVDDSGDRSFFKDLPHASIFASVLTPEAGAEFEVGKVTVIDFKLEDASAIPQP